MNLAEIPGVFESTWQKLNELALIKILICETLKLFFCELKSHAMGLSSALPWRLVQVNWKILEVLVIRLSQ